MTSPSAPSPGPEALATGLADLLGAPVEPGSLQRLTGGASRETWAFRAGDDELILRRDPPGRRGAPGAMQRETDAMLAAGRAGLRAPEVLLCDESGRLGTAGMVMRRVPGETIARRILRDDTYERARSVLVGELGAFLAGLHAVDPAEVPGAADRDPLEGIRDTYAKVEDRSPTFEAATEWLVEHRPPRSATTLVHGDLRMGNLIVDQDGLAAVIDWEVVHLGDPLEDLAWLCIKAWRFGARPEVGGLGSIDELVEAYEAAGGRRVDRDALRWWLVNRTVLWGVGCMAQASFHLSGAVRSLVLAATGRRAAEQEWDTIELLAPDGARTALAAPVPEPVPDEAGLHGRPTARELLAAVRELLGGDLLERLDRGDAYDVRVAANVLAIVERELARPAVERPGRDWPTLARNVRDRLLVASPGHLERSAEELGVELGGSATG